MQKPFVVAAAFAAGMISIAFTSQDSAAASPRADQTAPAANQTIAKPAKAKQVVARSKTAAEPCPYLFGCAKDNKTASNTKAGKTVKVAKGDRVSKGDRVGKARRKVMVDMTTTASIAPRTTKPYYAGGTDVRYSDIVARYAASYGVPARLAHAVIKVESNYRPGMVGSAGEIGLMQIKPATARMMGYSGSVRGLYDPDTNIKYGMKYLAMARELAGGTTCGTILKYNAGHAAKRMNPISAAYCRKVQAQLGGAS